MICSLPENTGFTPCDSEILLGPFKTTIKNFVTHHYGTMP